MKCASASNERSLSATSVIESVCTATALGEGERETFCHSTHSPQASLFLPSFLTLPASLARAFGKHFSVVSPSFCVRCSSACSRSATLLQHLFPLSLCLSPVIAAEHHSESRREQCSAVVYPVTRSLPPSSLLLMKSRRGYATTTTTTPTTTKGMQQRHQLSTTENS